MKQYSEKDLVDTLKKVGIKKGSTILIHSAIHALGKMNSVKNEYIPKKIYYCIKNIWDTKVQLSSLDFFIIMLEKKNILIYINHPPVIL